MSNLIAQSNTPCKKQVEKSAVLVTPKKGLKPSPFREPIQNPRSKIQNRMTRFTPSLALLISLTGVILSGVSGVRAQELPGCFMKTDSNRVITLNTVCVFPAMSEEAAIPQASGVYTAKILRREAGIPVINVMFNGRQPFEMMVDTGASGTVITPVMAELLGVVPVGRGRADTPSQKGAEFDIGLVASMEVGGASLNNTPVAIAPSLNFGLLGQDFFGRYDVTIKENVIEFRERSQKP